MAIAHVGSGTVLHETSLPDGDEKFSTEFADSRASAGTVVHCLSTGSGGTVKVYTKMKASGTWVEESSDTLTAGSTSPLILDFDYPLGVAKVSFDPTVFGDVTLIEVQVRSKGR